MDHILHKYDECQTGEICGGEVYFISVDKLQKNIIEIKIFGVSNMTAISEIVSNVLSLYGTNEKLVIEFSCYSDPHKGKGKQSSFSRPAPFLTLDLKRRD
jgi:hypothetical protein